MTDEERAALRELLHGDPAATAGTQEAPRPRRGPGHPLRRPVEHHPGAADRLGQGRRRQVVGHHQPVRSPWPSGATRSPSSTPTCGASRSRACSASSTRRWSSTRCSCRPSPTACAASRWASSPRRTSRSSGGGRCCTRRSSSSSPTCSGTTPTSCSSTCPRAPATSPCRWPSSCPGPRSTWSPRPSRPPSGWPSGPRSWPRRCNLEVKGVIENMSWFTGDDGTRYELFGAGGGAELAERLEVPLLGQVPLVPAPAGGLATPGRPIVAADPDGEAARAFAAIADRDRRRAGPHPPLQPRPQAPRLTEVGWAHVA